jgi:competence protein ComEA
MVTVGTVLAGEGTQININTATVDELVQLQRIGQSYAAKIIEYREVNGPFEKPEDIMNVPGIGPKTFEINRDFISVK